jgi:hypothetical protein
MFKKNPNAIDNSHHHRLRYLPMAGFRRATNVGDLRATLHKGPIPVSRGYVRLPDTNLGTDVPFLSTIYRAKDHTMIWLKRHSQWATMAMGLLFGAATPTRADLTLDLVAGPGVDLTHLTVGQTFDINLIATGTNSTEHIISVSAGGSLSFFGNVQFVEQTFVATLPTAALTTDPILATFEFTAIVTGSGQFTTSGTTARTNLATYTNLSSGPLDYTVFPASISVPEPSTAIAGGFGAIAFIAYGWSRHRREQRRQAAA